MNKSDKTEYPKSTTYKDDAGKSHAYHFSHHEIGDKVTAHGEAFIVVGRQPTGEWIVQREVLWGPLEIEKRQLEKGTVLGPMPLSEDHYIDSVRDGWVMLVTGRPLVPLEEANFGAFEEVEDAVSDLNEDHRGWGRPLERGEWMCDCGTINDDFDDTCFACGDDRYGRGGGAFWGW